MEEPVKNIMSLPLIRFYEKESRCPGGVPRKCFTHLSSKVTRIIFIGATFSAGIMVFMIPHEAEAVANARQGR
jgi:hypothetical protein